MKILITGSLGHIGSKLIRFLPSNINNVEIYMLDCFITNRYTSLFNLPKNVNYKFYDLDINKNDIEFIFKENLDFVIHLAALTEATTSIEKPEEYEKINFESTKKVAQLCDTYNVKLVHFSSTSIYGSKENDFIEESDKEKINPQSPYASIKYKEEKFLLDLFNKNKLKFTTLRLGSICGISPGMRFHSAISKFCYQSALNIPLSVWKTALNQSRPFLNINDAIRAICFFLKLNNFSNQSYNVVTANYSVKELVDIITKYKNDTQLKLVDSKIMNDYSYNVSNIKIKNLGFEFRYTIEDGIKETLELLSGIKN